MTEIAPSINFGDPPKDLLATCENTVPTLLLRLVKGLRLWNLRQPSIEQFNALYSTARHLDMAVQQCGLEVSSDGATSGSTHQRALTANHIFLHARLSL